MQPTRQGWLCLVGTAGLFGFGRLLGLTELYVIGTAVVALVAVGATWVARRPVDIVVSRRLRPHRVHAGNPCTVDVELQNRSRRTTPVLRLRDPVTATAGADLLLSPISMRRTATVAYRLPTVRRGLVTVGPMSIEVSDPFGLVVSRIPAARAVEVTVLPRIDDVAPLPRTVGPDPDGGARTGALGRVGEDFAALRPYAIGDDLRRVHWPSSARVDDDLLVRQDDVPWQGRLCVVLDLRREAHDAETIERAVSATASIVRAHLRRGDHTRIVSTTGVDSDYGIGAAHLDWILEYLAVAERSGRGSMGAALDTAERGANGAMVVVTGRPSGADSDAIEAIGPAIARRCIVHFDPSGPTQGARRSEVVAVPEDTSFPEAWSATASGALRRRPRSAATVRR